MPNAINKEIMEQLVPRQDGELVKQWKSRVSQYLGLTEEEVSYRYDDKRSKRLILGSRLMVISDQISKVQSEHNANNKIQGELYVQAIRDIRTILERLEKGK